ncbi:MAG: hypothetical protein IJ113_08865, partial [Eggerthellaceae bacterium]|nr:hypothetical protein [Eggerthellaceae bacterium]
MATKNVALKRKTPIAVVLAIALALIGGVFGFGTASGWADDAVSWRTLPTSGNGQRITFDTRLDWQNVTAGAEDKIVRYQSVWQNPITITLPTAEDVKQPNNYKDAAGNPNYKLAGWALAGKSEDGVAKEVHYYAPGEAVTLTPSLLSDNNYDVIFLADWQPQSYNFGSASHEAAPLDGVKTDTIKSDAIKTKMYDISASVYNLQHVRYTNQGWSDNHSGPVFIDHESANGPNGSFGAIARPNGNWLLDTGDGYTASVNRWTGSGGAAAQGLWTGANAGQMFNEATPGVNYVGDANEGSLFYIQETDKVISSGANLKGYYVYDSDDHAAAFNQNDHKFYVYNSPQSIMSYNSPTNGFLPFNQPRANAYQANNGGGINYHFGMVTDIDFHLTGKVGEPGANKVEVDGEMKDMEFYFSGDDDVWVFVDGELALDIGGIHGRTEGSINFATGEVKTARTNGTSGTAVATANNDAIANLDAGTHKLTIYYLERGSNQSNNLTAFLLTLPTTLEIQKLESQTGEKVVYPGVEFLLQNLDGKYYHLKEADPNDPLSVPQVSYVDDKSEATPIVVDEDGLITIRYIVDGQYTLTETKAPENYVALPGKVGFTVKNSKIVPDTLTFEADATYSNEDMPYTMDEDWSDQVTVKDDEVTLNVSNDRRQWPLDLIKKGADGKTLDEVTFNIYEVDKGKDFKEEDLDKDAVLSDAVHVYEGTTKEDGKVETWNFIPKNTKVEELALKQGAFYYITEKHSLADYDVMTKPVIVKVTDKGVELVSGDSGSFAIEGGNVELSEDTLTVTNPEIPGPEKKVNEVEHVDLSGRDQIFTYKVSQTVPANAKTVSFFDELESVLEVVEASV